MDRANAPQLSIQKFSNMLGTPTDGLRPKPTLFGTKTVKGLGIIWYGDKSKKTYKVDVGGGKM